MGEKEGDNTVAVTDDDIAPSDTIASHNDILSFMSIIIKEFSAFVLRHLLICRPSVSILTSALFSNFYSNINFIRMELLGTIFTVITNS